MYSTGTKVLEQGLSRGARWMLGSVAMLFGGGMIAMAPGSTVPNGFYGFGAFCLCIGLACLSTGRVRQVMGRLIGLAVFAVSVGYLVLVLVDHRPVFGARSQPSLLNAAMFFVVAGLPALAFALFGRFTLRRPSVEERPASNTARHS